MLSSQDPFMIEVDQIYHLACPASPPHYQYNPIKTVKTSVMGTINMLGLAKRTKARFLLTSTSGIYERQREGLDKETNYFPFLQRFMEIQKNILKRKLIGVNCIIWRDRNSTFH